MDLSYSICMSAYACSIIREYVWHGIDRNRLLQTNDTTSAESHFQHALFPSHSFVVLSTVWTFSYLWVVARIRTEKRPEQCMWHQYINSHRLNGQVLSIELNYRRWIDDER